LSTLTESITSLKNLEHFEIQNAEAVNNLFKKIFKKSDLEHLKVIIINRCPVTDECVLKEG
jgi:hypothetical protein